MNYIFSILLFLLSIYLNAAPYSAKEFPQLTKLDGLSPALMSMHVTLYQGYVKNANLLLDELAKLAESSSPEPIYGALKRRFNWECDGMLLHEYYFENLGGKGQLDNQSVLYLQLVKQFGSYEAWKKDFIRTGMMRGIGWSILYRDSKTGQLLNIWINEHDLGHLAGGQPILIMDVFEHAYMPQYGLDRAGYIEAFFKNINWEVAQARLQVGSR